MFAALAHIIHLHSRVNWSDVILDDTSSNSSQLSQSEESLILARIFFSSVSVYLVGVPLYSEPKNVTSLAVHAEHVSRIISRLV